MQVGEGDAREEGGQAEIQAAGENVNKAETEN